MKSTRKILLVFALAVCMMLPGIGEAQAAGGTLRVAVIDEPPSLDQQVITADLTTMIEVPLKHWTQIYARNLSFSYVSGDLYSSPECSRFLL